jgi:small nuclear ribonucleoprotein (snRNP)-like protein
MAESLRKYLGTRIQIKVTDDRVFDGDLMCLDKQLNIVLQDTYETKIQEDGSTRNRFVHLVLINGKDIVSIHQAEKRSQEPTSIDVCTPLPLQIK